MTDEIMFWLEEIVEDDPLPYEIKHITFLYTKQNGCISLCMGGTEQKPTLCNMFDYFPLEAQYFDLKELATSNEQYFVKLMCYFISEAFSNDYLKLQFNAKKIYFGKVGTKPKFLFCL